MIFFLLFLFSFLPNLSYSEELSLENAKKLYEEALSSKNASEKREKFQEAVHIYSRLFDQTPSDENRFNLANTYFQLGQYGLAIYEYRELLQNNPRNKTLTQNLILAKKAANIPESPEKPFLERLLHCDNLLSYDEEQLLLTGMLAFTAVFYSFYLWFRIHTFRNLVVFSGCIALFFLISILYRSYFSPIEAIFIRTTYLKTAPDYISPTIKNTEITQGNQGIVVEVLKNGSWIDVIGPNKERGYVAKENIRILSRN